MENDLTSNNAMACVYRTAFALSALILSSSLVLAADPPVGRGNVSVNVNPTTGYYVTNNTTLRLPDGVRATPSAGATTVTKYAGGLKQSIPTGITIDAIKKTAPLSATVRATTQSVKGAATRCLTSAKCNVALLLAGAGLDQLFDGLDWVMGEGGVAQVKRGAYDVYNGVPDGYVASGGTHVFYDYTRKYGNDCSYLPSYTDPTRGVLVCVEVNLPVRQGLFCRSSSSGQPLTGYVNRACYYGGSGYANDTSTRNPVPSDEVAAKVNSNYNPDPSDWPALTPELKPDDVEITWAPSLQGEPKTTTHYDADGNPHKVTETNIWYDFDIRDNPSPQPKLDLKTREETKTYEDGVLTGTTTTNSTDSAGSDDTPPPPEPPIDCDLFPTACAWFEWTQEEPVEPDDDLSGLLQEVPIVSETYTITGGAAVCPAPLVLDLSVFGSREVSYQPLCDLASTMKYLYLALMSFAAAVLLNRSINRV